MTVLAFLYDDYYCNGIQDSFAGVWGDKRDACDVLKGGRYSRQNLELLDIDTFGIQQYRWHSEYQYSTKYDDDNKPVVTLTHRWNKDKPSMIFQYENGNIPDEYKKFEEAGFWDHDIDTVPHD